MRHITRLIITILILFPLTCFAVNPETSIDKYMKTVWVKSGRISLDTILDLIQDQKGYIWIGTYSGLVRFDGKDFEKYNRHSHQGFESDSARLLLEDKKGTLWIGTNGDGLAKYENHRFSMVTTKDGLPDNGIRSLQEDDEGGWC